MDIDMVTVHFLLCILEKSQIEIGLPQPLFMIPFKTYVILLIESWIKQLWRFLDKYNITLNSGKTASLTLRILGKKLLTKVFVDISFKVTNLIQLNRCRISKIALSLSDISRRDGIVFRKNSKDFNIKPK